MEEAYYFCNITPDQFFSHTPAELDMMVRVSKIRMGYEEPKQPMKDPEMLQVAQAISETYANLPKGVR
jgi:hypothetical protein